MSKDCLQETCKICNRAFDYGPHVYYGKYLPRYQMMVCTLCLRANNDGWNPEAEKCIFEHPKQKKLDLPERNAAGWLPIE
jgi:hypothetical protein